MLTPVKVVSRRAIRLLRLLPIPKHWWTKLDLLKTLVQRDLDTKYKGSILGNFWTVINQLAQLLVYTYLFSVVLKLKAPVQGLPDNEFNFGLFLFAGLIPWVAFTTGFMQASTSVVGQPNLVKKVVFPLTLLPLVPIISAFIESLMGLLLLITFFAFSAKTIQSTVWLLPLVWGPQLLLTAGLGYLAAGLTVFLRDVPQTVGVILNLWFYLTPIVYPASLIPERLKLWVFWFNPITIIVELYRDLVLAGRIEHWSEWGVLTGVSVCVFCAGLFIYQRLRPAFADVI